MNRRLHRKAEGQMICGVCTGLAEYWQMDVTAVRVITVFASLISGAGVMAYIIAALIMPTE